MGEHVPEPVPVGPEETRGGESPADWRCGTARARAAELMQYIKEHYGQPEDKTE